MTDCILNNSSLLVSRISLMHMRRCEFFGHDRQRMIYIGKLYTGTVKIEQCVVRENFLDDDKDSCIVDINKAGILDISNSIFASNTGKRKSKVLCLGYSANGPLLTIKNSTFVNNTCARGGAKVLREIFQSLTLCSSITVRGSLAVASTAGKFQLQILLRHTIVVERPVV